MGSKRKSRIGKRPVERFSWQEVVKAIRERKAGNATGPSEVSVEIIAVSGEIVIGVMVELYQDLLERRGMTDEWELSVVLPILNRKGDAMSCMAYRVVKLLEHAIKIVEKVLDCGIWSKRTRCNLVLCQAKER